MARPCPHIEGYPCPIMPGLECPELPGGGAEAKVAQCRLYAMRDGFLSFEGGRYERKTGWEPGQGPGWKRKGKPTG